MAKSNTQRIQSYRKKKLKQAQKMQSYRKKSNRLYIKVYFHILAVVLLRTLYGETADSPAVNPYWGPLKILWRQILLHQRCIIINFPPPWQKQYTKNTKLPHKKQKQKHKKLASHSRVTREQNEVSSQTFCEWLSIVPCVFSVKHIISLQATREDF